MLHRCLPLLALAATLASSPGIHAAEWVAEPSASLRGTYDDNIRLTSVDHDSVWGTVLDPQLKLSRRTELWDINVSDRVRAASYTGDEDLDSIYNYFDIAAIRTLERGALNLNASQVDDTTLQDEVLDADTGVTTAQVDRTTRNIRIAGEYLFAEDTWLEASVAYTTAEYDQGELYGLLDYSYLTPGLTVVHQLDQQTQVFGILSHSKTDYDTDRDLESETDSLQLGAAYDITETWKVRGSVGSRRTNTSSTVPTAVERPGLEAFFPFIYDIVYVPRDSDSTGLVYDGSLTRKFEAGEISMAASQSVTPSSTGSDTESTTIELNGTHEYNAKLSSRLAVSYYQSVSVGDITTQADYKRFRIAPSLNRRLDRDWVMSAGYAYTRIEYDRSIYDTVDNNALFVSVGYTWPRIAISR